jgi:hypothetical protein
LKVAWSPRGFSLIEERKRKSILRRVQVEEGFGLGFLPAGRSERALHEECSLKKALA